MRLSLLLSAVLGCQGADAEPSGPDDSAQRRCDYDNDCASDEFCHDAMCQRVDDRSFDIELGALSLPSDNDYSVCAYQVEIVHGSDSCVIHRPEGATAWDARCEWIVDLDEPDLTVHLVGDPPEPSYCGYGILWDLSGADSVVFLIRVGLVQLWSPEQEYGLYVGVSANF